MPDASSGQSGEDLASLQVIFRALGSADAGTHEQLLARFLLHPVCRTKLRSACAVVLKSWASRSDLFADVCQDATCQVTERLQAATLDCPHDDLDAFGGWIWKLWFNACRRAWRRYETQLHRSFPLREQMAEHRSSTESSHDRADDWSRIRQAIDEIPDPMLRRVMNDWCSGLNGSESARRLAIAQATISRYRQHGVRLIRDSCRARTKRSG